LSYIGLPHVLFNFFASSRVKAFDHRVRQVL
jgi:hypothetical protein